MVPKEDLPDKLIEEAKTIEVKVVQDYKAAFWKCYDDLGDIEICGIKLNSNRRRQLVATAIGLAIRQMNGHAETTEKSNENQEAHQTN